VTRNRRKRNYLAAAFVSVLIALTTACAGSPRVEYVYETPDIPSFPVFPDPHPVIYNEETDTVSMPLWYWQKIAEYKIDIDAIEIYIDRVKKLDN
jgi:hypothetical protein